VNGSWYDAQSVGQCDDEFALDLAVLRGADIPVVLAAGNEGPGSGTSVSPANLPGALAVGASDELQQVPDFSSRGPSACDAGLYPRLVAPGVELRTADLTLGGLFPASYATVSGTSFAAPHVAGALVLLAGAFPGTDVAHLEEALEATARDLGAAGPDEDSGHGLVDVAAAHAFLASSPACDDGRDDDGDGLTDFPADPGCRYLESEAEDPQCNDGLDNDADGLVDFGSDPQCFAAWRASEAPVLSCGIGPEILALLPWLRRWRGRRC
jgi:bacillopeptidase F